MSLRVNEKHYTSCSTPHRTHTVVLCIVLISLVGTEVGATACDTFNGRSLFIMYENKDATWHGNQFVTWPIYSVIRGACSLKCENGAVCVLLSLCLACFCPLRLWHGGSWELMGRDCGQQTGLCIGTNKNTVRKQTLRIHSKLSERCLPLWIC